MIECFRVLILEHFTLIFFLSIKELQQRHSQTSCT